MSYEISVTYKCDRCSTTTPGSPMRRITGPGVFPVQWNGPCRPEGWTICPKPDTVWIGASTPTLDLCPTCTTIVKNALRSIP